MRRGTHNDSRSGLAAQTTARRTAGEKCGLKRKQRLMAHPPDAVKPTPWGEQPHFYTSEATMSGRYTYEVDNHGCVVVYDRHSHCEMHGYAAADELNRLAGHVETLRELLKDVLLFIRHDADHPEDCPGCVVDARIDSALADTEPTG